MKMKVLCIHSCRTLIMYVIKLFAMCLCFCAQRYNQLLQRKGEMDALEKNLKEQQEKMLLQNQTHQTTADQCKLLKEENDRSDQPPKLNLLIEK